jgi:hypothetical protein
MVHRRRPAIVPITDPPAAAGKTEGKARIRKVFYYLARAAAGKKEGKERIRKVFYYLARAAAGKEGKARIRRVFESYSTI